MYPKTETIHIDGVIPFKSKTQLIGESEVILRGTVKAKLPSKWSNPNGEKGQGVPNIVQTDIVIAVDEIFKGTPYNNKDIVVRIDKGEIDKTKVVSDGYPDFTPGEEVVLFLAKDDGDLANPNENYYVLKGMRQGKFTIADKTNKKYSNGRDTILLSTFSEEIPRELENYKQLPKLSDPKQYQP
ncbi:hypothetical protein [Effusibacillus consociatus]|uniref:Uncharacterized protein n=1 Tax=Effusibacillus consociatus TaxID=1117041 RepID=A0ABV9Q2N7_9BACL